MSVQSVVHAKPDMSVLVEKPVKYASDPNVSVWAPAYQTPEMYVQYGNLAFFPVNGYLSHCWVDEAGLDWMHTINTRRADSPIYGPSPAMQWIADLMSDVMLTSDSFDYEPNVGSVVIRRFYHHQHGTCELHQWEQ